MCAPYKLGQRELLNIYFFLQRNKWDFFVFLWMGIATSFLGAAVGFHSKDVFKQYFFFASRCTNKSRTFNASGLWTEPVVLSSSESWMHFMVTEHPGAVLFMFLDVFLLTGALILTGAQAVQVNFRLFVSICIFWSKHSGVIRAAFYLSLCCMIKLWSHALLLWTLGIAKEHTVSILFLIRFVARLFREYVSIIVKPNSTISLNSVC